ncbi:3-hydroxyacyl-CoA dehydrogenase family protein [Papillibacter cinnamivorans]|uniref:3-hydroxyacyl-CoA dehydrogenase n=1 Tax=Papillibacter cinnamivorans DSM 12816 TaxID=1122930 RepID=A0A1W2BKY1_9FIRM|nr:3-hydroxyacyl-CoA dehydrogenase family protein [Papillibacter cinnamivorans]SMC73615.1 3-hydroxyacyl-CoA dehydrogenase [Papillibacter cinnamivorans DSM 12816]
MKASDIRSIACIGAGTIGASWASFYAYKGFPVTVQDVSAEFLEKCKGLIESNLAFFVSVGAEDSLETMKDRIRYTTEIGEAVRDAQLIQESITEKYEVKQAVLGEIDKYNTDAFYCSSTSGLLITEISRYSAFAARCVTAHPFNPPHLIPLVELVKGEQTSQETLDTVFDFYRSIGKEPVKIYKEMNGHVASRLQLALWREAIDLVVKGVISVEDVDTACQYGPGLRWGVMGPNMIIHLGGGEGGVKKMMTLAPVEKWWGEMASWSKFPEKSWEMLPEGCEAAMHGRSFKEMAQIRDERLIGLLKVLGKL